MRILNTAIALSVIFSSTLVAKIETVNIKVSNIPFKEASMVKGYEQYKGLEVSAIATNSDEQESYFDEDMNGDNMEAILVRITNKNRKKVLINSLDSKLQSKDNTLKNVSTKKLIEDYVSSVRAGHNAANAAIGILSFGIHYAVQGALGDSGAFGEEQRKVEDIRTIFYNKSLKHKILLPGETISGFVFYKNSNNKKDLKLSIPVEFLGSGKKDVVSIKVQ